MEMLTEVESEVIEVDIEEEEEEACLLGRLVTDQNWNPLHLIDAMKVTWKANHAVSAMEWGEKIILFRFNSAIDRDWVLKNQPWQFEGSLFAIQKFTCGNEQPSSSSVNVAVDHASFWARLYNVPNSSMNETSLRLFVKHIGGTLESVDRSGVDAIGSFVRFKMSVDITKPLVRGITIRVKGEVQWLPLNYEELPIYCFCCGSIGHCHKNCQNMKYGSGLNAPHLERRKCHPPQNSLKKPKPTTTLPSEIIENILSRLPAKSLHRFKAVSKQWKDKISDPRFAEVHLQRSKNSSSRNLLSWEVKDLSGYFVGEIQNDEIKFVSAIKHEWGEYMGGYILCYCDGLYLKAQESYEEEWTYVLWNPCSRTYKKIKCPYPIDDHLHGICYDPLIKDYKVVLGSMNHYAVYSCRNKMWSEMKEFSCGVDNVFCSDGVSFNGCCYWIINFEGAEFEIIYFDWRDQRLKKLHRSDWVETYRRDWVENGIRFNLTCFRGHLCLCFNYGGGMWIMKIVEGYEADSWMELKVEFPYFGSCEDLGPTCILNENEIIFEDSSHCSYLLYDLRKDASREIRKSRILKFSEPVPFQENLFLL